MTTWNEIGHDNKKAALNLVRKAHYRSAASRAYYAVFSKVSADLISIGVRPNQNNGFKHSSIRSLILRHMGGLPQDKRNALSRMVGDLYVLRLAADYAPSTIVDAGTARKAVSIMNTIYSSF